MWIVSILIGHLTYIVKQSGTLSLLRVKTQFCRHNGTKVSGLTSMLQKVLAIRRTILHFSNDTNQLWMEAVDSEVNSRTFSRFYNLVVKLFLNLGNNLFNASRVYTSIGNKLVKSQSANLTTYRVKARNHDGFRCVVNNNLNATGSLKRPDVASLTTNNTSLHLIIIDMEDANRIFNCRLRSHALNGLYNDLLCLLISIELSLVHDLIDIALSICASLVL